MKRFFAALLVVFLMTSMVSIAESGGHVETLYIGTTTATDTFSLVQSGGTYGKMNYNAICAAPFLVNTPEGGFAPFIMTDWEIAEDGLSMLATFATDQGICWHDGVPLTIDDIAFTFEYYKEQDISLVNYFSGVEIVDEKTLKITFDTPTAFYLINEMVMSYYPYPKHIWEKIEDPKNYAGEDATIACGPYKMTGYDAEAQTVTYEKYVDIYMDRELTVDKVIVKTYESHSALVMALISGEVDAMYAYSNTLDSSMKDSVTGVENLDSGMSINPGNFMIMFGFNVAPTNDLEFRKAVYNALDYSLLAMTIGGQDGQIASPGIVSPSTIGFDDSLPQNKQDVDAAAAILDAAGYVDKDGDGWRELPDGSEMEILITPQFNAQRSALYLRICEIIIANLANVGVKAVLDEESVRNSDYATEFRKSHLYEIFVCYCSPGVGRYRTAYSYIVGEGGNSWGTCDVEEINTCYADMVAASTEKMYIEYKKELQQLNAEYVTGIGLAWDVCYFPYRTDKYEGWINFPGYGVINNQTWYTVHTK